MKKTVIIIGAGPAGMMAAIKASEKGIKTVLLEKNPNPGRKLLITGKGRCNITNNADMQQMINNIPGNGVFLYSTLYNFSNYDIISFFEDKGLKTKLERGGRFFPVSDRAEDVVSTLVSEMKKRDVEIIYNSTVSDIITDGYKVKGAVIKNGGIMKADSVLIATGGLSYPQTGSEGDGYRIAQKLGHTVTNLKPSLVPLVTKEKYASELQGLSLKNIEIRLINQNDREVYREFGEMIFTHFGVSGPVVLSASRHILEYNFRNIILSIDLKPALDYETLDKRIQRDFENYSRKQYRNSLNDLLPAKLIPVIIELSGINPDKPVNQITRDERKILVSLLKELRFNITGSRPIKEAIVTSGGVGIDEIDPCTMQSKIVQGLFFAGEIIDVDGYTGGFNLTIAFSTGYTAGMNM